MRTPSSALPACPQGLDEGFDEGFGGGFDDCRRRPLPFADFAAGFFAASFTVFFAGFFARALDFFLLRVAIALLLYFLRILLCGLRLPILPLSLPAAGSITALTSVGLPESIASLTARLSSSGVVTRTPTPPNASIILS